ncbi:MAG: hypothetical protein ACYSYU_11750 [Planctomycetota bacterium]|jgi:hypothetical protein
MGIKISEMAHDTSIGGAEMIPESDAGSPKHITTADIKIKSRLSRLPVPWMGLTRFTF